MVADPAPEPRGFPAEAVSPGRARSQLKDLVQRSGYSRDWWAKMTGIRPHRMALILKGRDYPTAWELWLAERIFFDPARAAAVAALPPPTPREINQLRQRLGDSPEAFMARLQTARRSWNRWISGEQTPSPTRQRLLHWLRQTVPA